MTKDQEIYQKIAQILHNIIPEDGKIIIMKSELVKENDCATFNFDYINNNGEQNWVTETGIAGGKLRRLLAELREFMMSQNQPYWQGCHFQLDIETGKISIEFIYE
ncbi:immunity protein YezG family protein [Fluviispira vulneris]|uniref:immunity protein YezG family protein n=1 Tax=Fluviispira vulneris TaxID=2763012 RepID=UPI001646C79D|nr:immunity protein YezG family protein [Fluviispira vulneris]